MKLKHNWNEDCEWTLSLFNGQIKQVWRLWRSNIFGAVAKDLELSSSTI
jgi:hypothetical protein